MADTPDYQSADYGGRLLTQWNVVDTVLGGAYVMQEAGAEMLFPFPAESDAAYADRLAQSTFDNDYEDVLDAVVGMILRRPVKLGDNVPARIKANAENIDLAGTHLNVFAFRLLRKAIHYGDAYVVVDVQRIADEVNASGEAIDEATARQLNLRPYWTLYGGAQVQTRPRYVPINGKVTLQQIVFRELALLPDGVFGEKAVIRYRVWRLPVQPVDLGGQYVKTGPVEWELWEEQEIEGAAPDKAKSIQFIESGTIPLDEIPVASLIANPDVYDPMYTAGPTLYDLAKLCVKDYNQQSDHEANLHLCSSPIPFTVNLKPEEKDSAQQSWGKTTILDCDEGGMVSYAEPAGTGLQAMERQLEKNKQQIRRKGFDLLLEGGQITTTATEQVLRAGRRTSRLAQIAEAFKDCLERALQFSAQWYRMGEDAGGEVTLGVKGDELILTPADIQALSMQAERKQLSVRTLLSIEKRAGLLPDDVSEDQELAQIEDETRRFGALAMEMQPQPQVLPQPPAPITTGATA